MNTLTRKALLSIPRRSIHGSVIPQSFQGKYGRLHSTPAFGAQGYDPRKDPKRFSRETNREFQDEEDQLLGLLKELMVEYEDEMAGRKRSKASKKWRTESEEISISDAAPEGEFRIKREAYQRILDMCREGDISYIRLAHPETQEDLKPLEEEERVAKPPDNNFSNVVLFGADFNEEYPLKNLYKALSVIKPDAIVLQLRPDYVLPDFQVENFRSIDHVNKKAVFNSAKFLNEVEFQGYQLFPTMSYKKLIEDKLKAQGFSVGTTFDRPERWKQSESREKFAENFEDYLGIHSPQGESLRVSKEICTTTAMWHENRLKPEKTKIYLGEVPLGLQAFNIMTGHSLMEMEELFEKVAFRACSQHESLFEAALSVCPDIFLHHSDEYMAGLINSLSRDHGHKNIFVVCGYGQSRTIPYHLFHNPRIFRSDSLDAITRYNPIFETLIRKDTPEVMADKLALIDSVFLSHDQKEVAPGTKRLIQQKFGSKEPSRQEELYLRLLSEKYGGIVDEQQAKARHQLEMDLKRAVRNDPWLFKELP